MSLHLLRSEREDAIRVKRHMAHKDQGRIVFAFDFVCMVSRNPKTNKLSPMADNIIKRGGLGGLGSLVYICGVKPGANLIMLQFGNKI